MNNELLIYDFSKAGSKGTWQVINDVVMGGVSTSGMDIKQDVYAIFSGNLSPENNGGFASIRAEIREKNLENYDGVIVKVKGDEKLYSLRLRTESSFDGTSYQAKFKSNSENWEEVRFSFDEFMPTFRGNVVPNQPKLESENIKQLGFLIADKQFGEFELKIKWIKFYKENE